MSNYDEVTDDKQIQLMKTILPYVDPSVQMDITLLIHYLQLQNSFKSLSSTPSKAICACEIPDGSSKELELLKSIRPFFNPNEQLIIDNLINIFCMLDTPFI